MTKKVLVISLFSKVRKSKTNVKCVIGFDSRDWDLGRDGEFKHGAGIKRERLYLSAAHTQRVLYRKHALPDYRNR